MVAFSIKDPKIIFVHIPKSGGTSVSKALQEVYGERILRKKVITKHKGTGKDQQVMVHAHMSASVIQSAMEEDWQKWYSFCMVRNPWSRMVSLWNHIMRDEKLFTLAYGKTKYNYLPLMLEERKKSFGDWLKTYNKPAFWVGAYKHGETAKTAPLVTRQPQVDWIYNHSGQKIVTEVFKLEESDYFVSRMKEQFGIDISFGHYNLRNHDHYKSYYTDELIDLVGEWFRDDIEEFGYEY